MYDKDFVNVIDGWLETAFEELSNLRMLVKCFMWHHSAVHLTPSVNGEVMECLQLNLIIRSFKKE